MASGLRDAGDRYVVIDDCWQVARDKGGTLVPDPERFPGGMKALAAYLHARGLRFGLYTDAGRKTCQGRPGSYGFEEMSAPPELQVWAMPLAAGSRAVVLLNPSRP